jgi:hypothetical protein
MDIVTLTVLPEGRYDTARRKNTIAPRFLGGMNPWEISHRRL